MKYLLGIALAASAFAQHYEVGADIGYGFYQNGTIFSGTGSAAAGIRNRFAAGIDLGYEFSEYISVQFCLPLS